MRLFFWNILVSGRFCLSTSYNLGFEKKAPKPRNPQAFVLLEGQLTPKKAAKLGSLFGGLFLHK